MNISPAISLVNLLFILISLFEDVTYIEVEETNCKIHIFKLLNLIIIQYLLIYWFLIYFPKI